MLASEKGFRLSKWRLSYIFVVLTIVAGLGSYGWYIYTLVRNAQINKPQSQVERLIKDFRAYHAQAKQFPLTFTEINRLLWHTMPAPDYGGEGRQARTKNYYYYYTRISPDTCAFWALPTGPQRHYASTFFVVFAPDWLRTWKGKAISDEEISRLPAIPSPQILAELRMQELPVQTLSASKQFNP